MGYAGYVPAKLPPSKATPFQQALSAIGTIEALEILERLIYNTAIQPKDSKFRKIKLSNTKIASTIGMEPSAQEALRLMGWELSQEEEDGQPFFTLPAKKNLTMADVRQIQEAQANLKKAIAEGKRSKSSNKLVEDLRSAMEDDRRERAGQKPIQGALVAQALPNANNGPNVATAKDVGIDSGGCC